MIRVNENLYNILRLIDDEDSGIQTVIYQELRKNSLELILNKEEYRSKLDKKQNEKLDILLNNIHLDIVHEAFFTLMSRTAEDIDLENSMLILSYWNNNKINCQNIKAKLKDIANGITMPKTGHPLAFIDHISEHLRNEFIVSKDDENPDNYYLNRLLEKKQGFPLTLTILYIIISNRIGIPVFGVPIYQYFMLKFLNEEDEIFFDPFYSGKKYSRKMLENYINEYTNSFKPEELNLDGCSNIDIVILFLRNLSIAYTQYSYNPDNIKQIEIFNEILTNHHANASLNRD